MRYVMKQKLISLGDDFTIQDENGNDAFFVDGKVLSFGDKLVFNDMAGNELVRIEQKLLSWGPTLLACAVVVDMACHKDEGHHGH